MRTCFQTLGFEYKVEEGVRSKPSFLDLEREKEFVFLYSCFCFASLCVYFDVLFLQDCVKAWIVRDIAG